MADLSSYINIQANTIKVIGNITPSSYASPAPSLTGFDSVSALNLVGNGGNITYQQTNTFYVDPGRTQNYTPSGTQIQPFFTITAAITAATNAGYNDTNPAFIILLESITEDITLKPGIWLTSLGTGTHGSPIITGTVTVTSSTGTTSSNHYSLSNLRIIGPTNGNGIYFTGTAPQKLFVRDVWIDAHGTGAGIYMDNSGSGSTLQLDVAHLYHDGSGDIYCINVTKGNCYITDIETSGATQVAAVGTGAVLTIDGSELDAVGDVVCETYGTGSLTITNSIINNTQANGYGIKVNDAGSTVTIGQCLFSIPTGTGSVVYYNPAASLYGSTVAFASISFIPGTNTTIDARLLPVPLATVPGTIANPIFAGNITSTTTGTWTLTDNSTSSLSFDTAGKAGVLKLVTTNSSEGVTMSGYASATGNVTGGNIITGGVVSATGNVTGNFFIGNGSQLTGISATSIANGNSNVVITSNANVTIGVAGNAAIATFTGTGANITGVANVTGNVIAGSNSTTGFILGNVNSKIGIIGSNATVTMSQNIALNPDISASALAGVQIGGNGYILAANGSRVLTLGTDGSLTITTNLSLPNGGNITTSTGNITSGGSLIRSGSMTATAWTTNGIGLKLPTATFTDNSTAAGTQTSSYVHAMAAPALAFSNAVTVTNAATLFVAAPTAGANATLTNSYAMIANGAVQINGNLTANTNGFAIGYRDIPQVAASNTTLGATDGGKHYYSTTAGNLTLTIPNNATTSFATGTAISIVVQAAGNILVNAASGVTLYVAGNSTAANRVVGAYGMATLMKVASDTWFINGTGVS